MRTKIAIGTVLLCISSLSSAYIVDGARINRPNMLSYAKSNLQNLGIIEQTANGVAYLKVPDNYINELYQQIHIPGYELPQQTQIFIFNENEAKGIATLQELGQTVPFKPLGFYTVVVDNQEFFMLAIDSPELSGIRQKYGLTEKLEDHAFSITIGVRKIETQDELS